MRDEEIARLLEGMEMPTPAEPFAHALEAQVVATRPGRRAPLAALALVAAAACVAAILWLVPWPQEKPPAAPEDPAATGLALARAKRYPEAIAAFDRALDADRGAAAMHIDRGAALAAVHVNRAVALAYDGHLEDALQGLREAIRLEPDNAIAHADLGAVLFRMGDLDGAIAELREAIRLDPGNPIVHGGLAAVLCQMSEFEGALASADRAVELDPTDAHAHLVRAQCLRALGRFDEAAELEARARQIDPNLPPEGVSVGFRFVDPAAR